MNKTKLVIVVLCAYLLTAGLVSAEILEPAPVAGYSPNFADPQPITGGGVAPWPSLTKDANRLIRWQGWLDVDAFSVSVLNQIQRQVDDGKIGIGTFTLKEPTIAAAILKAANCNPTFKANKNLEGEGESFKDGKIKLYVWLYRHNFAGTGLYQLYISAKGKMLIGSEFKQVTIQRSHKDGQSLHYEFGSDPNCLIVEQCDVIVDIEIWRGAVVRVDETGAIKVVGNEAGVITLDGEVKRVPMTDWERAPSLEGNPHYNPQKATGPAFVEPLDRVVKINENAAQVRTGVIQTGAGGRVRTIDPYTYHAPQK